ncbi:hypothetical protein [Brevibacillus brevis]|uniref:hypothetical protein n=1 Tax=Brevibacillus brevis TaxID=1393 RepID=UPI0021BD2BFD|nr:hypothetical protein [Brevibacillus brevis]
MFDVSNQRNKLTLSNGKSYTFKIKSANELDINGGKFIKYTPSTGLKLQGKYESFSYSSNVLGTGYASSITYVFNKDGIFVDSSLQVTLDLPDSKATVKSYERIDPHSQG